MTVWMVRALWWVQMSAIPRLYKWLDRLDDGAAYEWRGVAFAAQIRAARRSLPGGWS